MIERGLGMLVAAALLASALATSAVGDVRRERTARRPYIVEIGEPYAISMETLKQEAGRLSEVQEYLGDYGYPDYAEIQEIEPEWPWDAYEVRMYYMRRNLETDFGHVIFSAALPDLGVVKSVGPIPMDKAHQIEVILQARQAPQQPAAVAQGGAPAPAGSDGRLSEALVARIEAAAERAAQAADRAVSESDAAVQAADRTDSIVNKLVQSAPRAAR